MSPLFLPLSVLVACTPSAVDDTAESTVVTTLFTIETQSEDVDYDVGHLVHVAADLGCEDLEPTGEIDLARLPPGVDYTTLLLRHGRALDGWLRTYRSLQAFEDEGGDLSDEVSHFWGAEGVSDESTDALELGVGESGSGHIFDVHVAEDLRLTGVLHLSDRSVDLDAEKCGMVGPF